MLTELVVRDLGVIDELALELGPGLTAVTGETGAGKTLVVGAIDLLTGGRADASLVRPGAERAEIEGRFVVGDDERIVRRVVPSRGRSRAYVDGHLAPVAALSELGRDLVDLHGQHAHQSLLAAGVQRAALDRFGAVDTAGLASLAERLRAVEADLAGLGGDAVARAREIDLLRHQCGEIDGAQITGPDEDERLDEAETVLADAAAHQGAAREAAELLSADGPVADGIGQAQGLLDGRAPFAELRDRLAGLAAEVADLAGEARARAEAIDDDPAVLAELRTRRQLLAELRRKYGPSLGEVLEYRTATAARLADLEGHEQRAAALEDQRSDLAARLAAEQARVLQARREASPRLGSAVAEHLGALAMAGALLDVTVEGAAGEQVRFRLAANAGHEPLPLARVASGGELARTMLALRLVLTAGPDTLVFDEVDAGVGGTAAHAVGRSLASLSRSHQVLVVTHLAQVAVHADQHVMVSKSERDGATVSLARDLDPEARVVELSRMLSGSPDSDSARRHAEELLAGARGAAAPGADPAGGGAVG